MFPISTGRMMPVMPAASPRRESPRASWPARRSSTMLEMLLCSLVTLLPDYLYRRYVQGKRFGKEITFYSVWFELRWGITGCLILTVLLITTVFYNHPSTTHVTLFYRTVPIVPETIGRVAEVNVGFNETVKKGQPLFRLDSSRQEAAVESARRKGFGPQGPEMGGRGGGGRGGGAGGGGGGAKGRRPVGGGQERASAGRG